MLKNISLALILLFLSTLLIAQINHPNFEFSLKHSGFNAPVDIANDGSNRLFIVEQGGEIKIIENGVILPTPFLDIDARVRTAGERGLLGMAFHPNYATNGYFYLYYINNSNNTQVSRFSVNPTNPNEALPASEQFVIDVNQPYSNHNGGCIHFGSDGYLYIGLGDGGSGGDPQNYAQNKKSLLGKMLRIDVDGASPYAIPTTNPFVNDTSTLDEIWSIGLRNPWRWSFDRLTNDMWIADVGQNAWEEVHVEPAGGSGGINYGWRCYEGNAIYDFSLCDTANNYVDADFVYPHNNATGGFSITGGYVYRGNDYTCLKGYYFCADYVSGNVWTITDDGVGGYDSQIHTSIGVNDITCFGEDQNGELYVANISGDVFRVQGETLTVNANPIVDTAYNATHKIISSGTVGQQPSVIFRAGDQIDLNNNFEVQSGKTFEAIINECP